jgi:ribosomal protein S18 acetylase RimI-like enzyme
MIRPARADDLPAIGRLGALLVRTHHDFDPRRFMPDTPETPRGYGSFLGSQLANRDAIVLVAEEDGEVRGYAYAGVEGRDYMALRGAAGVLHDLIVDPAHRGRGTGEMLLRAVVEALAARDVPQVVLSTAARNARAQQFFTRAGFRPTMVEMTRDLQSESDPMA